MKVRPADRLSVAARHAMRPTYEAILQEAPAAYEHARRLEYPTVVAALGNALDQSAVFVASGGMLATARFGADLYERRTGALARAITPLEFVGMAPASNTVVVLLSASGRHPDVEMAARAARSGGYRHRVLLTAATPEGLPLRIRKLGIETVQIPLLRAREGFLATTSVLTFSIALLRSLFPEIDLPETLPLFRVHLPKPLRGQCLAISGPAHLAPLVDLETRLHETGLATVQYVDYRNFAHGRHLGFSQHLHDTSVIALSADSFSDLAKKTIAALPDNTQVQWLETHLPWPASVLDLLAGSAALVGAAAKYVRTCPRSVGGCTTCPASAWSAIRYPSL